MPDTLFVDQDSIVVPWIVYPEEISDIVSDYNLIAEAHPWQSGMEPEETIALPGTHSLFILIIAILLLVLLKCYNVLRHTLRFYIEEMVDVRRGRDNVFDEHPTLSSPIGIFLTLLFVLCAGFLLSAAITVVGAQDYQLLTCTSVVRGVGIVAVYYLFELCAYMMVGYTFSTESESREWVRGFTSSINILGLLLFIPAVLGVIYPGLINSVVYISLILFFLSKIVFILKGFRIFYDNLFSWLYFILYLCTLEIIPLILVYNCSVYYLK